MEPLALHRRKQFEQVAGHIQKQILAGVVGKPVTLAFNGKPRRAAKAMQKAIAITFGSAQGRMPHISCAVAKAQAIKALKVAHVIKPAGLSHVTCQLDGRLDSLAVTARSFAELSRATNLPIKLELILSAKTGARSEVKALSHAAQAGGLCLQPWS